MYNGVAVDLSGKDRVCPGVNFIKLFSLPFTPSSPHPELKIKEIPRWGHKLRPKSTMKWTTGPKAIKRFVGNLRIFVIRKSVCYTRLEKLTRDKYSSLL
jgi:hypothetical protein